MNCKIDPLQRVSVKTKGTQVMYEWENYFEPHILVGIEWDIDEVADFDDIY